MRTFLFHISLFFALGSQAQMLPYQNVNAEEFRKLIAKGDGILLDVRTPGEYARGHIEQSNQLNFYDTDFGNKLITLPKDRPIYLYCNTGYRSRVTANFLAQQGYNHVYNLQRGIMEWNQQQFPVVAHANAPQSAENKMEPDEFQALIKSNKLVLVDFYAPWCAPCRRMMPMIDSLTTQYAGEVMVVKINTDASKNLTTQLQISSVPRFVLYKNGQAVFAQNGVLSREALIDQFVKQGAPRR